MENADVDTEVSYLVDLVGPDSFRGGMNHPTWR
jgi:hypothetical protein